MKKMDLKTIGISIGLLLSLVLVVKMFWPDPNAHKPAVTTLKSVKTKSPNLTNFTTQDLINKSLKKVANKNVATSILIYDDANKKTYSFTNSNQTEFESASIIKLSLLACALQQIDAAKINSDDVSQDLTKMIENSDNDAAKRVYDKIGGQPTLETYYKSIGATHTNFQSPDFGTSLTTAQDQLLVVNNLLDTPAQQAYSYDDVSVINTLTSSIDNTGTFGIGSIDGSNKNFKNGWIQSNKSDKWIVNSIGRVANGTTNNSYNVVILTDGSNSFDDGKTYTNALAQNINDIMIKE